VCGYWAYLLRQQTLRSAIREKRLLLQQQQIAETNAELRNNLEEMLAQEEELKQQSDMMKMTQDELMQQQEEITTLNEELEKRIEKRTEELSLALETAKAQEHEMRQIEAQLREKQHEMEKTQWLENNLSRFDDIMRLNYDKSMEDFADIMLFNLAKITGSISGAMFILDDEKTVLQAVGGYACTPATMAQPEFKLGEGLLGQAAKSQETIYLSQLPANSARVASSLANLDSGSLIMFPLAYNENLQGVIELVSMKPYDEELLTFIQRLSKNLAAMLQHIKNNLRTQRLLADSQELTFRLQEQAEELRQNAEELFATQEVLAAQNNDMQRKLVAQNGSHN
jgi:putative methionine-R-sulfoxide reductase with GAF domain